MKIAIVSSLYPPYVLGGAEKAASQLAEALVRVGHQVVAITLHPEKDEVIEQRNGVKVYRLPHDNFYWPFGGKQKPPAILRLAWHIREIWNFRAAKRVRLILEAEVPDVVHTHCIAGFSPSIWWQVRRKGIRLIHTLHDYYLICARSTLFRNGRNCENKCSECRVLTIRRKQLSHLPNSIISVSRYTLNEHEKRGYLEGVSKAIIHNICKIDGTVSAIATRREASHPNDLIFGYIGKIEPPKGIETLLEATRLLTVDNWRLRIAGSGVSEYVKKTQKLFQDPRVEWLGFVNAEQFYSSVDVVVIPSAWGEPLPYVCVEAVLAGKGLICARSGGIPEIAKFASMVSFFRAGDARALSDEIKSALRNPAPWKKTAIPDASSVRVFHEAEVVSQHLAVYQPSGHTQ